MSEIFRVENLCFSYNDEPFLDNISFRVNQGEMISVIGENGSGKSTLFKIINGLLSSYTGRVIYNNKDIKNLKYIDKAREIAVIYQNGSCSFPFTCFEVVAMGLYPHRGGLNMLKKSEIDFVKSIMELTDVIEFANKNVNCISGGQLQRVLLARALVQRPKLLFLDEAMNGLDMSSRIKMTDVLLKECRDNGLTVINISHDLNLAFEKSNGLLALKNGKQIAFQCPQALLNKEFFREVFNLEVEIKDNKYFRIIL